MKKELEKITNLTINELLNNEIILPSLYLEKFSYHAKEIEVNLDDESFEKELNKIIVEDFKTIERYMSMIISNVSELKEDAKDARTALLNKDIESLGEVYKRTLMLQMAGYKLTEIVEITHKEGILKTKNIETVKSRLFLARSQLKKLLNRDGTRKAKQ